jgi:xanthine dehydrogenase molybdopterin-binding subunit B
MVFIQRRTVDDALMGAGFGGEGRREAGFAGAAKVNAAHKNKKRNERVRTTPSV